MALIAARWFVFSLVLLAGPLWAATHKTFDEAQAVARKSNRPLLLYLSSD